MRADNEPMARTESQSDVVVRVVEGRSERKELVLEAGRAAAPVSMGTNAEWSIQARLVGAAHVMLAWSGTSLFVAATRGQVAVLDGVPLGPKWTQVRTPSELRFGGARISIRTRPDDAHVMAWNAAQRRLAANVH